MKYDEVAREIRLNNKARARRNNWPPSKVIGVGFNENDLLQRPVIIVSDLSSDLCPYNPTIEDINANDWRLV